MAKSANSDSKRAGVHPAPGRSRPNRQESCGSTPHPRRNLDSSGAKPNRAQPYECDAHTVMKGPPIPPHSGFTISGFRGFGVTYNVDPPVPYDPTQDQPRGPRTAGSQTSDLVQSKPPSHSFVKWELNHASRWRFDWVDRSRGTAHDWNGNRLSSQRRINPKRESQEEEHERPPPWLPRCWPVLHDVGPQPRALGPMLEPVGAAHIIGLPWVKRAGPGAWRAMLETPPPSTGPWALMAPHSPCGPALRLSFRVTSIRLFEKLGRPRTSKGRAAR